MLQLKSVLLQLPGPIMQGILDLYPSCAVTRAMAMKAKLNDGIQDIDHAGGSGSQHHS